MKASGVVIHVRGVHLLWTKTLGTSQFFFAGCAQKQPVATAAAAGKSAAAAEHTAESGNSVCGRGAVKIPRPKGMNASIPPVGGGFESATKGLTTTKKTEHSPEGSELEEDRVRYRHHHRLSRPTCWAIIVAPGVGHVASGEGKRAAGRLEQFAVRQVAKSCAE